MTYIMLNFFTVLILFIMILLGVAFYTLFERKLLGYIQDRKGPNKLGVNGLVQPFADAVKLMLKEKFFLNKIYLYYYLGPMLSIIITLFMWMLVPFYFNIYSLKLGILMLFCVFSMGVYSAMIGGWASSCNYSMIGAVRSVAQSVSYEVSMILLIFNLLILIEGYSFSFFLKFQDYVWFIFWLYPNFLCLYISFVAELNRSPFDLVEGESELVSGFNTEYFSSEFVLIFLAEYSSIMFMSFLLTLMFMGLDVCSIMFYLMVMIFMFSFIWIRGVLPRIRYDQLMWLCWKKILIIALGYFFFFLELKIYLMLIFV